MINPKQNYGVKECKLLCCLSECIYTVFCRVDKYDFTVTFILSARSQAAGELIYKYNTKQPAD